MTDGWGIFSAIATAVGALATGISAIIIAIQTRQTRKSVENANQSLSLARAQSERDKFVFTDGQKARIDAEMPRLSIRPNRESPAGEQTLWGRRVTGQEMAWIGLNANESVGATDDPLLFTIELSIVNDGPRQADLNVLLPAGQRPRVFQYTVASGETRNLTVEWFDTVNEWTKLNASLNASGEDPLTTVAEIRYSFPGDRGADETHRLVAMGSPIAPHDDGSWVKASNLGVGLFVVPFERIYWASRREGRMID